MAKKAELKEEQDKIVKGEAFESRYLCRKNVFGNDYIQNMFVYQSTFNMLESKINKSTESVTGCKSKGLFERKHFPLHGAFMSNVKRFGYKIRIQFNITPLVVDQKKFVTKIVNAYDCKYNCIYKIVNACKSISWKRWVEVY